MMDRFLISEWWAFPRRGRPQFPLHGHGAHRPQGEDGTKPLPEIPGDLHVMDAAFGLHIHDSGVAGDGPPQETADGDVPFPARGGSGVVRAVVVVADGDMGLEGSAGGK